MVRQPPSVGAAHPSETTAIRAIAEEYDLLATWPRRPDYLDHLLESGRVVVARTDAGVLGYGGAFVGPRQTHLTDLFVRADVLGRGTGRALLAALDLDPATTTTFASADPRAQALYRKLGLRKLDQLSYLVGTADDVDRLRQRVEPIATSPAAGVTEAMRWHSALRGGLHGAPMLSFLSETAQPLTWPVGYAWLRVTPDRVCVGPLGSNDRSVAASVVASALLEAARVRGRVQIVVARSHAAHAPLLESGFTANSSDTLMARDPTLLDPTCYCPDPYLG